MYSNNEQNNISIQYHLAYKKILWSHNLKVYLINFFPSYDGFLFTFV